MRRIVLIIFCLLFIIGCASHPTIRPIPLKAGETYSAVTFSFENVLPVFVYRKGLSDVSDFGLRIGLPIYGSGIDYSRVVFQRGNFCDILNFGFSISPNSSLDMTYYTVRRLPAKPQNTLYSGFRTMYIPHGISGKESLRVGGLVGINFGQKVGIELGYFHDLDKGQPVEYLFSMEPHNDQHFPAITDFGLPSEHSRLVGLSLQLSLSTQVFKRQKQP